MTRAKNLARPEKSLLTVEILLDPHIDQRARIHLLNGHSLGCHDTAVIDQLPIVKKQNLRIDNTLGGSGKFSMLRKGALESVKNSLFLREV